MGLLSRIGKVAGSRAGIGAIAAGGFGAGFLSQVGPATRDAAFQVAFDDPNADVAFLGRKLDTRYLAGRAIGEKTGGLLKATSGDYWGMEKFLMPPQTLVGSPTKGLISGGTGAGIGAGIGLGIGSFVGKPGFAKRGALIGAGIGGLIGGSFGLGTIPAAPITTGIGTIGGAVVGAKKRGFKGALVGGAIGTLAGGTAGTAMLGTSAAAIASPVNMYVKNNERFFTESPFSSRTSTSIANSLNASGDIVLGMHNSRRGY